MHYFARLIRRERCKLSDKGAAVRMRDNTNGGGEGGIPPAGASRLHNRGSDDLSLSVRSRGASRQKVALYLAV